MLDQDDYLVRQRAVSLAALKVAAIRRREGAVDRGESSEDQRPTAEEIEAGLTAENEARLSLTQAPARPAAVYEVAEFLRRAMSNAKTSVSISTRGLAPHLVDRDFIRALEHLLRRGVQVTILLHEEANLWRSRGKDWIQSFDALAKPKRQVPCCPRGQGEQGEKVLPHILGQPGRAGRKPSDAQ